MPRANTRQLRFLTVIKCFPLSGRRSSSQQETSRIRDEITSDGFYGGLLQRNGARMHMGKFGVWLAQATVHAAARVYEHAAAT